MASVFLVLILLSPLPFGSNRAWAFDSMAVGIAFLSLLLLISGREKYRRLSLNLIRLPIILFVIVAAWCGAQISLTGPDSLTHPFYSLMHEAGIEADAHLSLWSDAGLSSLMRLCSYALVFVASFMLHQSQTVLHRSARWILNAGFAYSLYGMVLYFNQNDSILWFAGHYDTGRLHSTFINPNNFATFAGLSLLLALPGLLDAIREASRYGLSSNFGRHYFYDKLVISHWPTLIKMAVIGTALLLSQSRGGFLATAAAFLVFFLALQLTGKMRGNTSILLALLAVLLYLLFDESGDAVSARFNEDLLKNERLLVYDLVHQANQQNPWLGHGLGSFEKAFRLYRDENILGYYDKAHNSYLELIFEIGYPAALLLCTAVAVLLAQCLQGIRVRRQQFLYPAVGLSAGVLVAVHAIVDFSLQIPAVAYTFCLILGLAVAQSKSAKGARLNRRESNTPDNP